MMVATMRCSVAGCEAVVVMMSVVVDFEREPRCRITTGDPAFSRDEGM